jgi:hypothetical protein
MNMYETYSLDERVASDPICMLAGGKCEVKKHRHVHIDEHEYILIKLCKISSFIS